MAKNCCLVILLFMVSKVFKKLVNNITCSSPGEVWPFLISSIYGFRSFRSIADLQTVVSDYSVVTGFLLPTRKNFPQ